MSLKRVMHTSICNHNGYSVEVVQSTTSRRFAIIVNGVVRKDFLERDGLEAALGKLLVDLANTCGLVIPDKWVGDARPRTGIDDIVFPVSVAAPSQHPLTPGEIAQVRGFLKEVYNATH